MLKQYLYNDKVQDNIMNILNTNYRLEQSPQIYSIKNGIILPRKEKAGSWGLGGVIDENDNFVEVSKDNSFGGYYNYDRSSVIDLNCNVLYLGHTISHWGTFLTDFTRRLYYYFLTDKNIKIAFCGINFAEGTFGNIEKNCYDFFDILGIQREQIIDVRVPMKFLEVIIPQLGFDYDKYFYKEYLIPFKMCQEKMKDIGIDGKTDMGGGKIYLTRTKFWPKKEFGEKYIEKMFGKNGYKIVSPERLNLSEQIRLFSRADEIVSIEGTVAHNILFARENTNQVIIRKRNTHNKRQPIFNQITKTTVSYIDCFYNPFHLNVSHDSGPFLLLFNDNIKEFFLDRNLKYNNLYIIYNMSAILFYTLHILFHKIFDVCIKIKLLILKTIRVLKVNGR